MKKLKIFLMLSILLCLGLFLNNNVSASSSGGEVKVYSTGPKLFEVNDILPATTQLRISWIGDLKDIPSQSSIRSSTGYPIVDKQFLNDIYIMDDKIFDGDFMEFISPYTNYDGDHAYCDIDTSTMNLEQRTIAVVDTGMDIFTWQDMATGPKPFEVGDTLPAGYIKISWDFTGKPIPEEAAVFVVKSGDDFFNDLIIRIYFNWSSYKEIEIFNGGSVNHFNADTPGFTIIELTEPCEITDIDGTTGATTIDYNVYVGGALLWEVVSQDYYNGFMEAREIYGFRYMGGPWMSGEAAWNHGYDLGSEGAWDEGFEYGMEIYGYYDPITDQWLSVEEYLELYGTDKPGQSDFYNNFDKYFIPAMIIVFGGAIVLTILKVFKGRE